jgi:hypothetical protein
MKPGPHDLAILTEAKNLVVRFKIKVTLEMQKFPSLS